MELADWSNNWHFHWSPRVLLPPRGVRCKEEPQVEPGHGARKGGRLFFLGLKPHQNLRDQTVHPIHCSLRQQFMHLQDFPVTVSDFPECETIVVSMTNKIEGESYIHTLIRHRH